MNGVRRVAPILSILGVFAALAASPPPAGGPPASAKVESKGGWLIATTDAFAVWTRPPADDAARLAERCETLRAGLSGVWLDERGRPSWASPCVIVLHPDADAYGRAVGRPGDRSVGCTTLEVGPGGVTFRRVDLRRDAPGWEASALPHELTHVVLADRLGGRPLPLWADEGLAVLAEPEATRRKRDNALVAAIGRGAVYPAAARDGFYGQSALVASMLLERGTPAEFLRFLDAADRSGYEAALRRSYGIDGVAGLERLWDAERRAAGPGSLVEATGRAATAAGLANEARALALNGSDGKGSD